MTICSQGYGKLAYLFFSDGHGEVGQEISGFLKENLPIDLNKKFRQNNVDLEKDKLNDLITNVFIEENEKLTQNTMINSILSGSTCVTGIFTPKKLITANVGDSRCILGRFKNGQWTGLSLTRDQKPDDPDEKARILSSGGRIEPLKDEDDGSFYGPNRVWLRDKEYPGLAMSRSFGDRVAHQVGVIEEPEIKEYSFLEEDKILIFASDGLFEFMKNQEIIDIIKNYYEEGDIVTCCEDLYKTSKDRWMDEEGVIDDITMIVIFFE